VLADCCLGDKIKEDESGVARGTYGARREMDVGVLVGKREERRQLGRVGVDGRITLEWMLTKQMVRASTWFVWVRTGTSGGPPLGQRSTVNILVP
jgi:hypothetical protein